MKYVVSINTPHMLFITVEDKNETMQFKLLELAFYRKRSTKKKLFHLEKTTEKTEKSLCLVES